MPVVSHVAGVAASFADDQRSTTIEWGTLLPETATVTVIGDDTVTGAVQMYAATWLAVVSDLRRV